MQEPDNLGLNNIYPGSKVLHLDFKPLFTEETVVSLIR